MKYFQCYDPKIKALVALRAIKGESVSHLSSKYHVNVEDIVTWKKQLLYEMHIEQWMEIFFSKQPYSIEKKNELEKEPF